MNSVLDAIGNTPLVELRHMPPKGGARIVMKLESANPTGSMKDRMARAMMVRAEEDGRLTPGREIVEFTGGSTGTSLAFVCAAKGYPLSIVTSDAFSIEKRNHMKAFGAMMTIEPSENGMVTPDLFVRMRTATEKIVAAQQTGGQIDAFVHAVGTCGSLRGTVTRLREHQPTLHVVAVEPSTSAVLSGGAPGAHRMEGMGTGRVVPMWDPSLANGIEPVSTEEAEAMARRLAREEAIFAGTSTGANVVAAIRVATRMRSDSTVLTIAVDSGLKYVSTALYR